MTVSLVLYQGMKLGLSLFLVLGTLRSGVDSSLTRENTKKKVQMNKTEEGKNKGDKDRRSKKCFSFEKEGWSAGNFFKSKHLHIHEYFSLFHIYLMLNVSIRSVHISTLRMDAYQVLHHTFPVCLYACTRGRKIVHTQKERKRELKTKNQTENRNRGS